jgi:hypothetical protein
LGRQPVRPPKDKGSVDDLITEAAGVRRFFIVKKQIFIGVRLKSTAAVFIRKTLGKIRAFAECSDYNTLAKFVRPPLFHG